MVSIRKVVGVISWAQLMEGMGTLSRKIKETFHNTLYPASVDKSVNKVALSAKNHQFLWSNTALPKS